MSDDSFGARYNEAARQLRQHLESKEWRQADLERQLRTGSGKPLAPGHMSRILNGDRLPGRSLAAQIWRLTGIPVDLWDQPANSEDAAQ